MENLEELGNEAYSVYEKQPKTITELVYKTKKYLEMALKEQNEIIANLEDGKDGKSAYQIWLDLGNSGTEQDFINSLKGTNGTDGTDGKSAYQVWLDLGNSGTEEDFINSLKRDDETNEGRIVLWRGVFNVIYSASRVFDFEFSLEDREVYYFILERVTATISRPLYIYWFTVPFNSGQVFDEVQVISNGVDLKMQLNSETNKISIRTNGSAMEYNIIEFGKF